MKHTAWGRRCAIAFSLAVLGFLIVPLSATAERPPGPVPDGGFGPNNRPVYFVISLTDTFEVPPELPNEGDGGQALTNGEWTYDEGQLGSQLMLVPVGTYVAGLTIGDTRFEGESLTSIDLSALPIDPSTGLPMDREELNHNQVSVLGSFCTYTGQVHMVTPDLAPIPASVQEAFFSASALFGDLPPVLTTVELVHFIQDNQGDAAAGFNEIAQAIFATPMTLTCTTCFAEGDLFPHDPKDGKLFNFDVRFDRESGDFELNICLPIAVSIKGQDGTNPINLKSKGVLPVTIPSTEYFDAVAELDVSTLQIGTFVTDASGLEVFVGVPIVKSSVSDENGDGKADVVVHFDSEAIAALAGVDADTTTLRFAGRTYLGMCVEGEDLIKIVPPAK